MYNRVEHPKIRTEKCIYVFCMDLRTNSDYFHYTALQGFYTRGGVFTARYGLYSYLSG